MAFSYWLHGDPAREPVPDREVTMRSKRTRILLITLALALAAWAGPDKLVRQILPALADELVRSSTGRESREDLAAGHVQRAYDKAKKALRKEPSHGPALEAMAEAGAPLLQQRQVRVFALAAVGDTLAACDACLRLDAFRRELANFAVYIPSDPQFAVREARIREGGAGIYYRRGQDEDAVGRPRRAYDEYRAANTILPGYRDVAERIRTTSEAAIAAVAIMPWQNQTGVAGLSLELTDKIYLELGRRITPRDYPFTVLMGRNEVFDRVPLSALDNLSRDHAVQIGRDLGADLIVVGRIFGLQSQNNSVNYIQRVYRPRPAGVGKSGQSSDPADGYIEETLTIVRREMILSIRYEFTVLDTRTGYEVATRSATIPASVVTVFTDFRPEGNRREYRLYPANLARTDPERVKRIEREWKERVNDWRLPDFLERAHADGNRTTYRPEDRARLHNYSANLPIFLGSLPPPEDLARVALDRVWVPVLGVLRELDR